ncbi:MAG: NfeD family protein [Marinospirillum sp.]|nr:NfeD family protein [Marinospirillum sp.]
MATSIVAVFLGLGALVTGIFLYLGWIDSLAVQLLLFSGSSLLALLLARRKLKTLFVGSTLDPHKHSDFFTQEIGQRVVVTSDFVKGAGRVELNGVHWDAYSNEPLKKGDVAWITHNQGIELYVASHHTETSPSEK